MIDGSTCGDIASFYMKNAKLCIYRPLYDLVEFSLIMQKFPEDRMVMQFRNIFVGALSARKDYLDYSKL